MGFLVSFAFRNLGRHRRRTLITAGALAIGLGVFLLVDCMLRGADVATEQNLIWYESGAAKVVSPEAAQDLQKVSLKAPLADSAPVLRAVRAAGFAATARTQFTGELTATGTEAGASRLVKVTAVDPDTDPQVFPRKDLKLAGRWFNEGEAGVVLGLWLAEDLGLKAGSTATLTTRTRDGSYQVLDLEVTGVVESPDPILNRTGVYLPLSLVAEPLGLGTMVTEVAVGWAPGSDTADQAARLRLAVATAKLDVKVLTWRDLASDFLALSASKQKSSTMILLLVFLIAAVGVGNTFLLAFYERKTEIGMLRALGMSDKTLFWAFLTEAAGIGVLGSALGLVIGAVFVSWMTFVGWDLSALTRSTDIGYRIAGMYYGVWSPSSFVVAAVLGIVLAAVCAIGPTRRALRLPITESLRSE